MLTNPVPQHCWSPRSPPTRCRSLGLLPLRLHFFLVASPSHLSRCLGRRLPSQPGSVGCLLHVNSQPPICETFLPVLPAGSDRRALPTPAPSPGSSTPKYHPRQSRSKCFLQENTVPSIQIDLSRAAASPSLPPSHFIWTRGIDTRHCEFETKGPTQ